jgi:hypothetical protein
MATSQMNFSLHSGIIQAIRQISVDRGGRGYFVNTLEQVTSDFRDQITIDDVRDPGASASRIGRRPETPVLDSWRLWNADGTRAACWWINCSFLSTVDFIEKIFVHEISNGAAAGTNITWGTLLRYFTFIHSEILLREARDVVEARHVMRESDGAVEPEMDVAPEQFLVGHLRAVNARGLVDKFNNEEAESMNTLTSERARELGYLCGHPLVAVQPESGPTPEQTTSQINNESVRKLQDIIDSVSRGEKVELNEGEYLQLSDYLKRSFVS